MAPPFLPHGPELMTGFRKQRIKTSDAEINVAIAGEAPPLLLLHGNPLTLVSWHKVVPSLAQGFTVVATDLRGYDGIYSSKNPPQSCRCAEFLRRLGALMASCTSRSKMAGEEGIEPSLTRVWNPPLFR